MIALTDTTDVPARVVVFGAPGLIGHALVDLLEAAKIPVVPLGSSDIDLCSERAADQAAEAMLPGDTLVMLSALTPDKGRDTATFVRNVKMADAVCRAMAVKPPAHVVYMSSDAVYPMTPGLIHEATPTGATDLYGAMHMARERMFESVCGDTPLAITRCSQVAATHDTHNSYGPNRFRRQALAEGKIILGGNGEETRDHVWVDDVARLLSTIIARRGDGVINLASGVSHSFRDVAEMVADNLADRPEIVTTERNNPITHRHFDVTVLNEVLPDFRFTPLPEIVASIHAALDIK
tara:strand:- start:102852 stop:103733 length:882 start_codon:yes stop_codon:yes gene_type:complete